MSKAKQTQKYQDRLLIKCKSWGGPCTNIDEIELIIGQKPEMQEVIVRTELSYFRQCHRSDIINRKDLYKLNGISHEERLENFLILLGGSITNLSENARLPTNSEALQLLTDVNLNPDSNVDSPQIDMEENIGSIKINELYVTLWNERRKNQWYLSYCVSENNDGTFHMDHMHRVKNTSHNEWKYPDMSDTCYVELDQILSIKPIGKWDFTIFTLDNANSIEKYFFKIE